MACRGSGQVISNLGGTPSTLACPWCAGGGVRVPGIDAQARWLAADGEDVAQRARAAGRLNSRAGQPSPTGRRTEKRSSHRRAAANASRAPCHPSNRRARVKVDRARVDAAR